MRGARDLPGGRSAEVKFPRIGAVATAVPRYELDQSDVTRRIRLALGPRSEHIMRLLPMFGNTGIERRYSCVPIEWYEELHDWPERNAIYLETAMELFESATRRRAGNRRKTSRRDRCDRRRLHHRYRDP